MKKIFCVLLCCFVILTFCGCDKPNDQQSNYSDHIVIEETVIEDEPIIEHESTSEDKTISDDETINDNETVTDQETSQSLESSSNIEVSSNNESSQNQESTLTSSEDDGATSVDDSTESSQIDPSSCVHSYTDIKIEKEAQLFDAGVKRYICKYCGDSYTTTYPVEKIKLLSIGNSFSQNAFWSFYQICKDAGVKEIDIAIMYIGGCSLDQHWENVENNAAAYEVFRNNSGSWTSTLDCSIESLLNEGGWDIITLQNKSEQAAEQTKFSNLDNMVDYVSGKCPDAKILWHMTWAFTKDSKYLDPKYEHNDTLMFKDITECTQSIVAKNPKIHSIVPVGTAIMNARTSRVKNNVHLDDGSHLSSEIGYYVAALTWFGAITDMPLYDVNFVPLDSITIENIDLIRESAENALERPYQITQSYYTD